MVGGAVGGLQSLAGHAGHAFADDQGAWAILPAFQVGLFAALWIAVAGGGLATTCSGSQTSAAFGSGPAKPGGITPTIVYVISPKVRVAPLPVAVADSRGRNVGLGSYRASPDRGRRFVPSFRSRLRLHRPK